MTSAATSAVTSAVTGSAAGRSARLRPVLLTILYPCPMSVVMLPVLAGA